MKKIQYLSFILVLFVKIGSSQSVEYMTNSLQSDLIKRYELRSGKFSNNLFTSLNAFSKSSVHSFVSEFDTSDFGLSKVDKYNFNYLKKDSKLELTETLSLPNKPILKWFYRNKTNLFEFADTNFQFYLNPGFNFQIAHSDINSKPLYTNTRSLEIGGSINNSIGFYSFVSENQLRVANHERDFISAYNAFPGAHLIKEFKNDGIDFLTASGYINFKVLPSVNVFFGQGRNFIGYGKRSLLLSDFATDYTYLKFNTKYKIFNYQNIYAQLIDRYGGWKRPLPKKYMAAHYLSFNITEKLNIGLYEAVVFHDNNNSGRGFDLHYLNPLIFYRSVEHQIGDADKLLVGINLAYMPFKNFMFYSQFILNEFRLNDLRAANGSVYNKYGYQLGVNYVEVVGVSNLDLGIEFNRVRPYTYTHYSVGSAYPVNSYSHFNQHLAHPLGANFQELIFSLKYQALPKLFIDFSAIIADYGADSLNSNWGQNIFLDYATFEREFDNRVGQGVKTNLNIFSLGLSYHIFHNLFVDLDVRYRMLESEIIIRNSKNLYFGTALRLNLQSRKWSY